MIVHTIPPTTKSRGDASPHSPAIYAPDYDATLSMITIFILIFILFSYYSEAYLVFNLHLLPPPTHTTHTHTLTSTKLDT